MTEIPDGVIVYEGDGCPHCWGTGRNPEAPLFRCRVIPPDASQAFHELLQEKYPDHDDVECYCCCLDCPGWTQDEDFMSEEEIAELIPLHDYENGKPLPVRLSRGISSGVQPQPR